MSKQGDKMPVGRRLKPQDKAHVAKALKRHMTRPPNPDVAVKGAEGNWRLESPYEETEDWEILIFDAFGTRSTHAWETFIWQLTQLCGQEWLEEESAWRPDPVELSAAVNFVNSIQPKNEHEAALAVQMCAVHIMTMKMAQQGIRYTDYKAAALTSRLARTYAQQLETMRTMKGKKKPTKQTIKVVSEKHIHEHKHVHFDGGCPENGGQPFEPEGSDDTPNIESRAIEGGPALPCENKARDALPMSVNEREEALPDTWREKPGRTQRKS